MVIKTIKTYNSFIEEGLVAAPKGSYLYTSDKKDVQRQAQQESDHTLREKIRKKIKSGDIDISKIKFKYILNSKYDFNIILPDSLKDFLYKNGAEAYEIEHLEILLEETGHRIHINQGLPYYLRGLGIGYSVYKNFIKYIGWAQSGGDALINAKLIWKKLLTDTDFYIIVSPNKIMAIDKNIIGKPYILAGTTLQNYTTKNNNKIYSDQNVIDIVSRFLKKHDIESLKKVQIDPELIEKYPVIKSNLDKYLKYNVKSKVPSMKFNYKNYKMGDLLEFELVNGKKYNLIISEEPDEYGLELSDITGGDKGKYYYGIYYRNGEQLHELSYRGDNDEINLHNDIVKKIKIKSRTVQTVQA